MRLLGRGERDPVRERIEAKVEQADRSLSAASAVTKQYWDARERELKVVDAQVDARRRNHG